jgi:hypothetical protein
LCCLSCSAFAAHARKPQFYAVNLFPRPALRPGDAAWRLKNVRLAAYRADVAPMGNHALECNIYLLPSQPGNGKSCPHFAFKFFFFQEGFSTLP